MLINCQGVLIPKRHALLNDLFVANNLIQRSYRGTPPYSDLVITATLFWPDQKLGQSFSYFKEPHKYNAPINMSRFFGGL